MLGHFNLLLKISIIYFIKTYSYYKLAELILFELSFCRGKRLFYLKILAGILVVSSFYYLPRFKEALAPSLLWLAQSALPIQLITNTLTKPVYGGAFYTLTQGLALMLLSFPVAFIAAYFYWKKKLTRPPRIFLTAFIVALAIVVTRFSFYQRFLIPLDLFAVCLAGCGFVELLNHLGKRRDIADLARFYGGVCIAVILVFILKTGKPLISTIDLNEIRSFKPPGGVYILSTAKEDPAWLLGYTDFPVIAWDFGEFNLYWTDSEWETFLGDATPDVKIGLLKRLPTPLYFYINDKTKASFTELEINGCLIDVSSHFYRFTCSK